MNAPTINYLPSSDTERVERMASRRSTTSSRLPGRAIEGTVWAEIRAIVQCPDCGLSRYSGSGPHAPHQVERDGRHTRVDCVGREVSP